MALSSQLMVVARWALLPLGFAVAAVSLLHAASETEVFSIGPGASNRLGLDANIAGDLADLAFKAELAQQQQKGQGSLPKMPASLTAMAKESFSVDPLEVSALRSIALGDVLQEDEERARRIMRIAARMSKRDSITNLWLAQDFSRVGDVDAMLASFDHALRTSPRVRESMMKPVVEVLASQGSYVPLGGLLAKRPEWEDDFWIEVARNPIGNTHVAQFLEAAQIPLEQIPERSRLNLYLNLKRNQQYDVLFNLAELDPRVEGDSGKLATGNFVTTDEGNPLGWTLHSQGSFAARVHGPGDELQIDARSGSFGKASDRIMRGGGDHLLSIEMVEPVPDHSEIKLVARCMDEGGGELARTTLRAGDRSGVAEFSAANCGFVSLELSFVVEPGRRDSLLRIAGVEVTDI